MPGIGGLVYKSHLPVLGEDVPPKQMISERRETLPATKTEENKKVKEKYLKSFKFTEGNKMKKKRTQESERKGETTCSERQAKKSNGDEKWQKSGPCTVKLSGTEQWAQYQGTFWHS